MDARQLFVDVVSTAANVPAELRAHAADLRGCERLSSDESYFEFLDTQIRLGPRGPEWTERLVKRRAGLSPYCSVMLVRGSVHSRASDYMVYVDPGTRSVVYWEEYESDGGASAPPSR